MTFKSVKANGLPSFGVKVMACNYRALQSYPSDAIVEAYTKVFTKDHAQAMIAAHVATGHPESVIATLKQMGFEQKYQRTPLVEMYRVEQRQPGQQVGPDGWVCDLHRVTPEWDNVPTHYEELKEPTLTP